jgi:acetyl-CoA acetyltransferase family protein
MRELFIIAGIRTPFIRMGTDFAGLSAVDLGREACSALLTRSGIDPAKLSEVIFGCVGQPYDSANVARIIALRSGVPVHVPAVTVHRNCASGFEALTTAHQRLAAGMGDLFIVGGCESMSQVPLFYPQTASEKFGRLAKAKSPVAKLQAMSAFRPRDFKPEIGLQAGLTDPFSGMIMGDTAELLAREYHLSRAAQDAFAAESHRKASTAREALSREIAPVYVNGKAVMHDNGVRGDSTVGKLGKLKPIFDRQTGSVTAGNSSQITDGAVALLVGTESAARHAGLEPIGKLVGYAYAGCDPARMGLGPVHAIALAKQRTGLSTNDADVIEINEAFAAQVLAVVEEMNHYGEHDRIDLSRINRRGGSIALGHPVGATGARLVLTALHQLHEDGGKRALVSLCVGGGQGAALWLERT